MSGNQSSRLCARLGRSIPDVAIDCEPAPGAHLVTQRSGYEHHGIYVGNGRVVHYAGFAGSLHLGPIEETTLIASPQGARFVFVSMRWRCLPDRMPSAGFAQGWVKTAIGCLATTASTCARGCFSARTAVRKWRHVSLTQVLPTAWQ